MTSSQQRQLSKLIRNHKSTHVIHATRVNNIYDWTSLSEWKFDKNKWWVLMGQTCGHGTTSHKSELTGYKRLKSSKVFGEFLTTKIFEALSWLTEDAVHSFQPIRSYWRLKERGVATETPGKRESKFVRGNSGSQSKLAINQTSSD